MARCATATGVSKAAGTEIAQPLFSQRNTTGTRWQAAQFTASWKSPSAVAPSPNAARATASLPRSCSAIPRPRACGIWVAMHDDVDRTLRDTSFQWPGIWRPPECGSSARHSTCASSPTVGRPRPTMSGRSR